jgi:hypothetical protein
MSDPYRLPAETWRAPVEPGGYPEPRGATSAPSARPDTLADSRVAIVLTVALAVAGALLGLVWSTWSGPQQSAYVLAPGKLEPISEVETMVGADGRYLLLVGATGLLAGLVAWILRPGNRGPLVVAALGVGGVGGAALTWWVGYLTGGGTYDGQPGTFIRHLPLTLHLRGFVFIEPAVATLLYGLCVAFAARDDLGRPDPVRDASGRRRLVHTGGQSYDGGGDRDGPRPLQQGDLPPQ